jgi:hypothetical protein
VNYVIAGYSITLGILFLYAVSLAFRRRRLARTVAAVDAARTPDPDAVTGGGA